jgi:hypothetical protein
MNSPRWTQIQQPTRSEAHFWAFLELVWLEFQQRSGLSAVSYGRPTARGPNSQLQLPSPHPHELQGGAGE